MIERLELHRWRAFDSVAIDFAPGTTFLVAPNGVGKTSLLLGLTWALFGEHSKVDARTCVRIGHDDADAVLTLGLTNGDHFTIDRSVTVAGRTSVRYSIDTREIPAADALVILAEEFGAPIALAARLAVVRSGKDDGELQLDEHLYDAFGISGIRRAAALATRLHKQAEAARKKLRSASSSQLANRGQLSELAANLGQELDELQARRQVLAGAVTDALQAQQTVTTWKIYDEAMTARTTEIGQLLAQTIELGLAAEDLPGLAAAVTAAMQAKRSATDRAQAALDEARAQALAARSALALLGDHDPSCPTCARPFHSDELERAIIAQNESLRIAEQRINSTRTEIERLVAEGTQLKAFESQVALLGRPIDAPSRPRPTDDPDQVLSAMQDALQHHDQLAGRLVGERRTIVAQLDDDAELQATYTAERVAWRREALTKAAATALTGTAERVAKEQVEPLSQQVRWRWKALFGEDGLQLKPDGTIVRVVGDRELPWNQLSSGEQIWARLVAGLLVLRSSTTLPFAWLDEPLEHLDPRARRIVATDLASSTRLGRPAQIIVTTYEHTLARQLAEDLPATSIRHINRSGTTERPREEVHDQRPRQGPSSPDRFASEKPRRKGA